MTLIPLHVLKAYSVDEIRGIPLVNASSIEAILMPSKRRYIFNPASREDDDGITVLTPAAGPTDCCGASGRWELEGGGGTGGDVSGITAFGEYQEVGGAQTVNPSAVVDVGSAAVSFTLTEEKIIRVDGSFSFSFVNSSTDAEASLQIGLEINGVTYMGDVASGVNVSGFVNAMFLSHWKYVALGPGTYTAKLRAKAFLRANILSDSDAPSYITVAY